MTWGATKEKPARHRGVVSGPSIDAAQCRPFGRPQDPRNRVRRKLYCKLQYKPSTATHGPSYCAGESVLLIWSEPFTPSSGLRAWSCYTMQVRFSARESCIEVAWVRRVWQERNTAGPMPSTLGHNHNSQFVCNTLAMKSNARSTPS